MTDKKAQAEKEKGNSAFKAGDYPGAIGHYTAALIADKNDYTFPLNRAAAYLKLGKNEDAERDCTTVLSLSALNAKALFRRGQARIGMGKFDDALLDLTQASKREPSNESIREELQKVNDIIAKKKTKISAVGPTPPVPTPKRRRVPIRIIDSTATPSTSAPASQSQSGASPALSSSASTHKNAAEDRLSKGSPDTELKPVSTRSLKPAQPTVTSTNSATTTSDSSFSSTVSPSPTTAKSGPPHTFKDAKQARESAKPSRVGGGIFRASGESTIFPTRDGSRSTPESRPVPSAHANTPISPPLKVDPIIPAVRPPQPSTPTKPPMTLFDFSRAWQICPSTEERWNLITTVPSSNLSALFKTSLEPALLTSILAVFEEIISVDGGSSEDAAVVKEYMNAFTSVDRFGTVVLFLSREEKAKARKIWEALGVAKTDVGVAWRPVWP